MKLGRNSASSVIAIVVAAVLVLVVAFGNAVATGAEHGKKSADRERPRPLLTILCTAETHGALFPCDCPLEPMGGVARRATLIARYRARGPVVLLDAGGWAAGGIYDELGTGDPARDRLRTELLAKAMEKMKYDAAAVGDEEMPYLPKTFFKAGVSPWCFPLLAANLFPVPKPSAEAAGHGAVGRFVRLRRGGVTVFAAGLTTTEKLWRAVTALPAGLPRDPLDQATLGFLAAKAARPDSDASKSIGPTRPPLKILLAHVGEDLSATLAGKAGFFNLVVNAHRKSSARDSFYVGNTLVVNFNYESRRLIVVEVYPQAREGKGKSGERGKRKPWRLVARTVPLGAAIPDAPEMTALLKPHLDVLKQRGRGRLTVEYWTMAYCPGSAQVYKDVAAAARDLAGRVRFEPHFLVGRGKDGKLRALHGEEELRENRLQALIWKYYPEKFWAWLAWRDEHREADWTEGAKVLDLLRARLRGALTAGEGDELLARDALLAARRRIAGTPTLVFGNRIYEGDFRKLRLESALCALLRKPKPAVCAEVPVCFYDSQCRRRGFVGRCENPGTRKARCVYTPAVPVPAVVVYDADALRSNHEKIVDILTGDLPGLKPRLVRRDSPEGRRLLKALNLERLPAYLLAPAAKKERGFVQNLGGITKLRGGFLVLSPRSTGANLLVGRPRRFGRVDLFVSRSGKAGQEAVDAAFSALRELPKQARPLVVVHDVLYWRKRRGPDGKTKRELAAPGGLAELEEAARAAAVKLLAPKKLTAYLITRGRRRGSSYWDRPLRAVGISPEKVRALAEGPAPQVLNILRAEADLLQELKAGGRVFLLAENCELLSVGSRKELRALLERLGRRGRAHREKASPRRGKNAGRSRATATGGGVVLKKGGRRP